MVPLVMIPALCCDGELYREVAAGLDDLTDCRTVMPSETTLAACAAAVLKQVPESFVIMGTSFGGHVAREVALAAPERVKGMWIIGAGAGGVANPQAGAERVEKLRGGREEEIYRGFADTITYLPGPRGADSAKRFLAMARQADPHAVARQAQALNARAERWNDLHGIVCPALLMWGREDKFSPAADGLRMAGLMPHARYVEIAECGHLPTIERPDEVIDAARHWLKASGLA